MKANSQQRRARVIDGQTPEGACGHRPPAIFYLLLLARVAGLPIGGERGGGGCRSGGAEEGEVEFGVY